MTHRLQLIVYKPIWSKVTGNYGPEIAWKWKTKTIFKLCMERSLPFQVDLKEFKNLLHKIFCSIQHFNPLLAKISL